MGGGDDQRGVDMVDTLTLPQTTGTDTGDSELAHGYCDVCYPCPDLICIALCGTDVTEQEDVGHIWRSSPRVCIVCKDMMNRRCKECGT